MNLNQLPIASDYEVYKQQLEKPHNIRRLTSAILAMTALSVMTADIKILSENDAPTLDLAVEAESLALPLQESPMDSSDSGFFRLINVKEMAPEARAQIVKPSPSEELGIELDSRVEEAINGMNLTAQGYFNFLNSIDTSKLVEIQQFKEFNPLLMSREIAQKQTEMFVYHFTVNYANSTGKLGPPEGEFDPVRLARGMAARNGHGGKCCGIVWSIGRDGTTYQMAPLDAKLNHNPPYDSSSTGVEIEAGTQPDIISKQYEAAAYLGIAVLDTKKLLGKFPLEVILKGHGEMRDLIIEEWNASRSKENQLGVRDDFNAPEMILIRYYIQQFLDANKQIIGLRPLAGLVQ